MFRCASVPPLDRPSPLRLPFGPTVPLPGVVLSWARNLGVERLVDGRGDVEVGAARATGFTLSFPARDRTGTTQPVSVEVSAFSGGIEAARQCAHWSETPAASSRVIIAPDLATMWQLGEALRADSVFPFVFVAPVGPMPPFEWSDPAYWRVGSVTLLADSVLDPPLPLLTFINMGAVDARVALPPERGPWREWLKDRPLTHDWLERLTTGAIPVDDVRPVAVPALSMSATVVAVERRIDAEGRLCRVVSVPLECGAARKRQLLVRSDRSCAELIAVSSRRSLPQGLLLGDMTAHDSGWRDEACARFLRNSPPPDGADVGGRLLDLFLPFVGSDRAAAGVLAAFVALGYVHAALNELPILVVRGGRASDRLALRRLMVAVCHAPLAAARTRAAQLARLADATAGTMLLDEPGPLVGPSGPTEVGRFLQCAATRDGSAYHVVSSRDGVRQLGVFGPKVVLAPVIATAGLACEVLLVDLKDCAAACPASAPATAAVRDLLYGWSMSVVDGFAEGKLGAADVLPALLAALGLADRAHGCGRMEPAVEAAVASSLLSPADRIASVLSRCGSGGHLAMAQVLLEVALMGVDTDEMTPERVGRWLAARPEIDPSRNQTRRRLHGQISRVYPLLDSTSAGMDDPAAAFAFCLEQTCDLCPYGSVCEATLPGMRVRKNLA